MSPPKRLAVVGSRDFNDYERMKAELAGLANHETVIISGGARGADTLAERYADKHGFALEIYPADWDRHGRTAGPIRNREMADSVDEVVAFWDGQSRGTKQMIDYCAEVGRPCRVVEY